MKLKNKIIDILKQCYDPEIPIDLWTLGLIYNIDIIQRENNSSDVNVLMSLTTPGCTMGQGMADDIKSKVSLMPEINEVNVKVTFEPAWEPEMMTQEARKKLGFDNEVNKVKKEELETTWE